jgi:hypothetical protein
MGFSNIGMALAYRDLQFGVEYRAAVTAKLSSALVTLATALYFGDYRALVCGILAGYVCEFVLSYRLHPYRPRWCTSRIPENLGHLKMVADRRDRQLCAPAHRSDRRRTGRHHSGIWPVHGGG